MNIRCFYCQTPFTIGRAELLAALQHMTAENLHHYDAHCPRCRRANSVARQRMEMFFPNWQQVAQEQAPPQSASMPGTELALAACISEPSGSISTSRSLASCAMKVTFIIPEAPVLLPGSDNTNLFGKG